MQVEQWRAAQHRYYRSLSIVQADGQLVGSPTSDSTRTFYAQQPWWPTVFREGRPWAGPFTVDEEGRGYWEVAVPIGGQDEPIRGALKVVIGTDRILSSILGSRIGRTGHMMLLSDNGSVLACATLQPGLHSSLPALFAPSEKDNPPARWFQSDLDTHGGKGGIIAVARVVLPAQVEQARTWYILTQQDPEETFEPLGMDDGLPDARPLHRLYLSAYWIDQSGVTNGLYRQCVEGGGCLPPKVREQFDDPQLIQHPVTDVAWTQAWAYCQ